MHSIKEVLQISKQMAAFQKENEFLLTQREIEVIACLLHGRANKTISALLDVSPKTIETHLKNIFQKLGCHSRESVINCIERIACYALLQQYYHYIQDRYNLRKLIAQEHLRCLENQSIQIVFSPKNHNQEERFLMAKLQDIFVSMGCEICRSVKAMHLESGQCFILDVTVAVSNILVTIEVYHSKLTQRFVIDENENVVVEALRVLEKLSEGEEVRELIRKIIKFGRSKPRHVVKGLAAKKANRFQSWQMFLQHRIKVVLAIGLIVSFVIIKGYYDGSERISSGLILPAEEFLLKRANWIAQIEKITSNLKDHIKLTAIVGVGGSGKTTTANLYAVKKKRNVVWFINAENEIEVIRSLEALLFSLSKTKEESEEVLHLRDINDPVLLKRRLLVLLKRQLKKNADWFLIYDNVDEFNAILEFLPLNHSDWGRGEVFVLTRNHNIQKSKYIDPKAIILMPELTDKEKALLFRKIISNGQPSSGVSSTDKLLDNLPSYPLDIATAAYFVRNTGNNLERYLEDLVRHERDFEQTTADVMRGSDVYFKTRYSIIKASLDKMITKNPSLKESLMRIGVLDPRTMNVAYITQHEQQEIINELLRYSLLNPLPKDRKQLSLHRSIHEIIHLEMADYRKSKEGMKSLSNLALILIEQMNVAINEENIENVRELIVQTEQVLKQTRDLDLKEREGLQLRLGRAYRYIGHYKKALVLLKTLDVGLNNIELLLELGYTSKHLGLYHDAIFYTEAAYQQAVVQQGETSLIAARMSIYMGTPYRKLSRYEDSKRTLERGLKIFLSQQSPDRKDLAWVYTKLGYINTKLGDLNAGVDFLQKALAIEYEVYDESSARILWTKVRLAYVYKALKDYPKAQELLLSCLAQSERHFGKKHTRTAWVMCLLGEIESLMGNNKLAEKHINNAYEIQKEFYPEKNIRLSWALRKLGEHYHRKGDPKRASHYFALSQEANQEKI